MNKVVRNGILGCLLAASCVSGATAGNYRLEGGDGKPRAQETYDEAYHVLVDLAAGCGAGGWVPVLGGTSCGAAVLAKTHSETLKKAMKKDWRNKLSKLAISSMSTSVIMVVPGVTSEAMAALLAGAADELHTEQGAKY